ncbi:MAG: Uma2 family endonuclease [Myxococcales bacterium]|nr:Uma2 family endonuclease [Myxococcales bacterium]MCB9523883.1 Uma2 family endonuclease [Myxococcales bacterium]
MADLSEHTVPMSADAFAVSRWARDHELVDGAVRAVAPGGGQHGRVQARLCALLMQHTLTHGGADVAVEVGFRLGPQTVRAPDVAVLGAVDFPQGARPEGFLEGAPTLAIEVISPGDAFSEVMARAQAYVDAGSRWVWVVDPRARVVLVLDGGVIHVRREGQALDAPGVLDGLSLPVARLFD